MEILTGIGDFLAKITPLVAGVLLYIIPTAKDRLDRKNASTKPAPVQQGQTVDYTKDYVDLLKDQLKDAEEIGRLRQLLAENGIPYDEDGKEEP